MNTILLILALLVVWIITSNSDNTRQPHMQTHTGNEVRAWLDKKGGPVTMDELVRKVKDTELQQPFVARPVLKMTRKDMEYVTRAYPDSLEKEEYLVIVTDSKGTTMEDIDYMKFVSIIPLDRFIA
jgi:hypothetical protein